MRNFFRRFGGSRRGNVAMTFALSLVPISLLVGGSVDLSRMRVERTKLQSAIDAAALAATYMPADSTNAQIKATIDAFIDANFKGQGTVVPSNTRFSRVGTSVEVWSTSEVPMTFAALLGKSTRPVAAHAVAQRGGVNVEVALVLDVTASMGIPNNKIVALRDAADDLIDIVVQTTQTPFRTRMAIVPYSNAVNVGAANAATLRGAVTAGKSISGLAWSTGTAKTPTAITRANPGVVTANNHGFQNNDVVYFSGVKGMTQLNGNYYTVSNVSTNSFRINVNTSNFGAFSASGTNTARVIECLNAGCNQKVTSNNHGFANGAVIYLTGISGSNGITNLNNQAYTVSNRDANSFVLQDSFEPGTYSSGGTAYCTTAGCQYYHFKNAAGKQTTLPITSCVSERIGAQAYTDAPPSGGLLGRVYETGSGCPDDDFIVPLTSNRTTLHNAIRSLDVSGSTAGQIGVAWGWYMLAPNFNAAVGNTAVPYTEPDTVKIAVLMTDGEFNTGYCEGVISSDSTSLVSSSVKNQCRATNGNGRSGLTEGAAFEQAAALCTAMKKAGIEIYTVGFDLGANPLAVKIMADCATDPSRAYVAANATDLNAAFRAIGDSIGQLRLTR